MIVRLAAAAAVTVATGCSLYFEGEPDAREPFRFPDGPRPLVDGPFPFVDAPIGFDASPLALPCIHEVTGPLTATQNRVLQVIRACEGGPIVSMIDTGPVGPLTESGARADWVHQYRDAFAVDADRSGSRDVIATSQNGLDAGIFWGGSLLGWNWQSLGFHRTFVDLAVGDLAPIGQHPTLVAAGDDALRLVLQRESYAPSFPFDIPAATEVEIATGRDFRRVAVADLNGDGARDLFFIARNRVQPAQLDLGSACQTSASPPAFTVDIRDAIVADAGEILPLLTGDVDGDGLEDVIGATPNLFVRGSRAGQITFLLPERAADVALGDVDGDGRLDILYIDEAKTAVRRLVYDDSGAAPVLTTQPWLSVGGDRLVLARLNSDSRDDVVLLRRRGQPDSVLAPFLSP